jgi:nucleotide-binding universal stress UspA family protein
VIVNEPSRLSGPPRSILLATDLSARSDRALDRAVLLAKEWRAPLTVLHVLENAPSPLATAEPSPSWRRPPDPLNAIRDNISADLGEIAETTTIVIEDGDTVDTVMQVAATRGSDLVVIGVARNGLLGELMLGRTVDSLLRRCRDPLLVVKARPRQRYRHIVVATDFSESSRHALDAAVRFFPEDTLTLFHAYDPLMSGLTGDAATYLRQQREVAEQDCEDFLRAAEKRYGNWRRPRVMLEYGAPNHLLHDYVIDKSADLVIAGTHGRGAILDIIIGSVAKRILEDVSCDVLIVPEPRART